MKSRLIIENLVTLELVNFPNGVRFLMEALYVYSFNRTRIIVPTKTKLPQVGEAYDDHHVLVLIPDGSIALVSLYYCQETGQFNEEKE